MTNKELYDEYFNGNRFRSAQTFDRLDSQRKEEFLLYVKGEHGATAALDFVLYYFLVV